MPAAGTIVNAVLNIFSPSSTPDVWTDIQGDVAKLIDQKLEHSLYKQLSVVLNGPAGSENGGLVGVLNNYVQSLTSGNSTTIISNWSAAHDQFTVSMGQFQHPGPFLALYAQVVNLRNPARCHRPGKFQLGDQLAIAKQIHSRHGPLVWDFVLWPFFDPDAGTAVPKNTREIYSDLMGGLTNNPPGQPVDTGTQPDLPALHSPW